MYPNLVSEVAKARIKNRTIAKKTGYHENTIGKLLKGETKASVELAFAIKANFFPDLSLSDFVVNSPAFWFPIRG